MSCWSVHFQTFEIVEPLLHMFICLIHLVHTSALTRFGLTIPLCADAALKSSFWDKWVGSTIELFFKVWSFQDICRLSLSLFYHSSVCWCRVKVFSFRRLSWLNHCIICPHVLCLIRALCISLHQVWFNHSPVCWCQGYMFIMSHVGVYLHGFTILLCFECNLFWLNHIRIKRKMFELCLLTYKCICLVTLSLPQELCMVKQCCSFLNFESISTNCLQVILNFRFWQRKEIFRVFMVMFQWENTLVGTSKLK